MPTSTIRPMLARLALGVGALAVLATGADHLEEFVISGIGLAASSLVGLWISEHSSLFGFSDHGYRPAIVGRDRSGLESTQAMVQDTGQRVDGVLLVVP